MAYNSVMTEKWPTILSRLKNGLQFCDNWKMADNSVTTEKLPTILWQPKNCLQFCDDWKNGLHVILWRLKKWPDNINLLYSPAV